MKFLTRPLLIVFFFLAALVLWYRPAEHVFWAKKTDWAAEYEKIHTPDSMLWGAMDFAREVIRSSYRHTPLTEFIEDRTRESLVRVDDDIWRTWYSDHFSTPGEPIEDGQYFCVSDFPINGIGRENGFLEIRNIDRIDHLTFSRLPAKDFDDKPIASHLRYPFRNHALIALAIAAALMLSGVLLEKEPDLVADSSAGKGCKIFASVLLSGVVLIAVPFLYHNPNESPPFLAVGGFVCLAGTIGILLYGIQWRQVRRFIDGEDCLVRWTCSPFESSRFARWEFEREKTAKLGLLLLVSAIILVVGLGFWIAVADEAAGYVFLFLVGLTLFLWMIAFIAPRLAYRRNLGQNSLVIVGKSGAYLNGAAHTWTFPGSRLEYAEFVVDPFPMIHIEYSYVMIAGKSLAVSRQPVTVVLPVPEGMQKEAMDAVEELNT